MSGLKFELDMSKFIADVKKVPELVARGTDRAFDDIKDDWVRESVDVAPIDSGNLRRQIDGDVRKGLDGYVEVTANATQQTGGRRFNYAYYIHEKDAGGRTLKLPGAKKKFLAEPAEDRQKKWQQWLEDEVAAELKKAGW